MTCHDAREQFSALVDAALAGPERVAGCCSATPKTRCW